MKIIIKVIRTIIRFITTRKYEYVGIFFVPNFIRKWMGFVIFRTGPIPIICPIWTTDEENVASMVTGFAGIPKKILAHRQFITRFNRDEQMAILYHEIGHVVKNHWRRKLSMKKLEHRIFSFEVEADKYAAEKVGRDMYLSMMWTMTEYVMDEAPCARNEALFENLARMSELGDSSAEQLKVKLLKLLKSLEVS